MNSLPFHKVFDSRKGRHLLQCRPLACPSFGTKCPKLNGDYVGNAPRPFPASVLPSHIPAEKWTEKRGDLMGIIQKICPGYPGSGIAPHIPPEKRSKWRRQRHIFLKNLPSLTGTFLDDFRTGPAGIFQNSFYARQFAQPEPPAIQWRGKTSSHIPRHFFIISKWGRRKIF